MSTAKKQSCSRCRSLKLRCLFDTFAGHGKCRRCYDKGTDCVFEAIAPRQRRKRTDTRVAALEKQIAGLKATIDNRSARGHVGVDDDNSATDAGDDQSDIGAQLRADSRDLGPALSRGAIQGSRRGQRLLPQEEAVPGLVGADVLPVSVAIPMFDEFKNSVLPCYPVLDLTNHDDFASLRMSRPLLLLGMITAGCRGRDQELFTELHSRLRSLLADAALVRGQCSLEIVQAILVAEVWYHPPEDLRHLNFYMWIQIAGTMIRQLGLWPWAAEAPKIHQGAVQNEQHTGSEVRTAFAVYLSMSTVAISLRRPMTMVWTDDSAHRLHLFERSAQSNNERRLIAWVKLQLIAEDVEASRAAVVSTVLGGNDQAMSIDRQTIRSFERRFTDWRDISHVVIDDSLQVHFFYCRIKLYELAVLLSYKHSDRASQAGMQDSQLQDATGMAYTWAMMSLIQACHNVIDVLLRLDVKTYLRCPTVTTVRALYAMREIYLLRKSTQSQSKEMSHIITEEALAVEFYVKRLKDYFERAKGLEEFSVPRMALTGLTDIVEEVLATSLRQSHSEAGPGPAAQGGDSTEKPPNDLEAILTLAATPSETSSAISPAGHEISSVASGQQLGVIPESQVQTGGYDGFNTEGAQLPILSEFDLMVMPDGAANANWIFPYEF